MLERALIENLKREYRTLIENLNRALIEDLNRALIVPYNTERVLEGVHRALIVPYKRPSYLNEQVLSWIVAVLACSIFL